MGIGAGYVPFQVFFGLVRGFSSADYSVIALLPGVLLVPNFPDFPQSVFGTDVEPGVDPFVIVAWYVLPAFDDKVHFLLAYGYHSLQ